MVANLLNNSLFLISIQDRISMFFNHLGLILLLLVAITIFVVTLSSLLDILDAKEVNKIKQFLIAFVPLIGVLVLYIILFAIIKSTSLGIAIKSLNYALSYMFLGLSVYNVLISILTKNNSHKKSSLIYSSTYRVKEMLARFFLYGEIIFMIAVILVPIIYILGASLSPKYGLSQRLFPDKISFRNYETLFKETKYLTWYWSTFKIAVLTMISAVLLSTTTAYIFSRYKFKGKKWGLITLLVLQMFPSFMGLIALFTLYKQFGLIDKPLALVIIYAAGQIPFNTWLIKGFLSGIPKSLDESARMDGANGFQIFFKIIFPLALPILTFVAVTQFMAPWMDYILASFLLIKDENYTLAVGLYEFVNSRDAQNYSMFAAGSLLIAIPIGTLYLSLQRFLIEGITAGANKG